MNSFYINESTTFHLEIIKNKGNFVSSSSNETWCELILDVKNEYFTYNLDAEGITDSETKKIKNMLEKFLNDKVTEYEEYETMEPYLTICLNKVHDESFVEFRINLLINGCFCGDYYSLHLTNKDDVKNIYESFNIID